ncbi:hypothetical protein [Bacillus thuringiensis]|uniref:hypothetical protein n=1 Tax=Bacillus thuringiensis TaxID=1428 RepID=UPI001298938A|nr:hypothetical protein [Bacillus thuringiensis]MEB8930814.1 hypothetical protein [Bacillus cereus]MCR6790413.1 hypothetical protein [Bacillus thuringiensis]MCR6826325.1 hypothetical protein [Bacillus thuringiensis]MCR6832237.1 hypothetical protein [Bacillus thuringiensis]MEB9328143.1 hypothetical protein [Bacillus cereus]
MIKLKGLNAEEYATIKEMAKKELSFKVNIRQWKRKYAYNAIDIRPTKKDDYKFTKEQLDEVYNFMKRHNLRTMGKNYFETSSNYYIIFNQGVTFVYKVIQ